MRRNAVTALYRHPGYTCVCPAVNVCPPFASVIVDKKLLVSTLFHIAISRTDVHHVGHDYHHYSLHLIRVPAYIQLMVSGSCSGRLNFGNG